MNVLVACEFSGIVRDAFIRNGHNAVSCDLLESESPGPHIQDDIRDIDLSAYDLMIAHPPCTYLAVSGARWFKDRMPQQLEALEFVRWLMDVPIPRIAIENPISIISSKIRKPDQIVQPWMFGHDASKKTCLWLKNLPPLEITEYVPPDQFGLYANQTPSGQNNLGPSSTRARDRSRTYTGIAKAMAAQWGNQNEVPPLQISHRH